MMSKIICVDEDEQNHTVKSTCILEYRITKKGVSLFDDKIISVLIWSD